VGGLALGSQGAVTIDLEGGARTGVYAQRATLVVSKFAYFSGAIGFERADYGNTLRAGSSATSITAAQGFSIGGHDITAFVGYADNGIDPTQTLEQQRAGLYGFGIEGLSFGLLSVRDGAGGRYSALKATAAHMAVYGFEAQDFDLSVDGLAVEYNWASRPGQELNFSTGGAVSVATGGPRWS